MDPRPEPNKQGEEESDMNLEGLAHTEKVKKKLRGERKTRSELTRMRHPRASRFAEL